MTIWIAAVLAMLTGCDPVTRHKITSTIFDGVPALPPTADLCREYHQNALLEERANLEKQAQGAAGGSAGGSVHPPYGEKRCSNCHDKTTESGFVAPKPELCFVCHKNILKGAYAHGPAAVGDCLACHVPHDSKFPKLLKKPRAEVCGVCHREQRQAQQMHTTVVNKGMACADCHNPHSGNHFFLD